MREFSKEHELKDKASSALNLQHNVINLTYSISNLIEQYFARHGNGGIRTGDRENLVQDAQATLRKISQLNGCAYEITRRVSLAMRTQPLEGELVEGCSLPAVWQEVRTVLMNRYPSGGVEIIEHVPEEFPRIACHEKELFEILYYLAQNAVQAMRRKGKLIIRASREYKAHGESSIVITLSDTGPGIPEGVLKQLFEPFFSTKPLGEGNGLGLCLVRGLVKRNRGDISVASFEGFGTTFTLNFSTIKAQEPQTEAA